MNNVSLSINGTRYLKWHEMSVTRSLERSPWDFDFSVANAWREDNKRRIQRGDSVQVKYGNEVMITGYVDDIAPTYDASSHRLAIRGRSKLADLVDCSGFDEQFIDQSLAQIAAQLAKPFGIKVIDKAQQSKPFANKNIGKGEDFWGFLEELARMRAVRLTDSPEGNLVLLTKVTEQSATPLVLGKNVIRARGVKSARELFSEYHFTANGDDINFSSAVAKDTAHISGTVGDVIKRHRPKVIVPAFGGNADDFATRADLQKRVNRGRAEQITYTVNGWTQNDGKTWRPGVKVPVLDDYSGINEVRTIMETRNVFSDRGASTEITVMPNYVLDLLPIPEEDDVTGL